MRNSRHPDRERVRIDFKKATLNAASNHAAGNGESLSEYVERLIEKDIAACKRERMEGKGNRPPSDG